MPAKRNGKPKTVKRTPAAQAIEPLPPRTGAAFPIVGIGASAGGLAAFEAFFAGMPAAEPGMAFVLVQHLAPDHKSLLADLVKRYTRLQVFEVEDGMAVQPNCAYIIPPNCDLALLHGVLQVLEPSAPRGLRLPIDFFFRSLAQDQHERAICIVLSGTGSDGTQGLRAVKGEGGLVLAQTPETTEYDGMPRSAIATGLVDRVLPPAEMPAQLLSYAAQAFGAPPRTDEAPTPEAESALQKVFLLLRAQTGHDFSLYKPSTIQRRIERRLAVHQIESLDAYVRYLQQAPAEVEALFRDLLIGVTRFFRDSEAFAALETQVIPRLLEGRSDDAPVRVWVPGCATGEEAYSIAMLLQERLAPLKPGIHVQIFASDIDRQAIAQARTGLYPASIAADLTPERLARFFAPEPGGGQATSAYRIHKGLRDQLVFSEQDVIKDPPFSRLDLISCRNLLIYLSGELQKKLIPLFHYALNPGGLLLLGPSESVGDHLDLFAALDRKAKLYQRKDAPVALHGAPRPALAKFLPPLTNDLTGRRTSVRTPDQSQLPLRELAERALLQQYGAAGALVTEHGEILYLHGRTGLYLEPAPGRAGLMNIVKMAREGLGPALTRALHAAGAHHVPAQNPGLRVKTNGAFTTVNLTVQPVAAGPAAPANLFMVILEEVPPAEADQPQPVAVEGPGENAPSITKGAEAQLAALEQALRAKEEALQAANEELETSNEELTSSNEEMQSVNEELQSTNEELETSKEELQSVNEELATVNAELHQRVADLSRANNDLNNLLAGTDIGTVFVDHQLRILRFTPMATQVMSLIPADVGRPVGDLVPKWVGYDRLVADLRAVLDDLTPREVEVQTLTGAWYLLRIRPYRTLENVIEGAVITFVDITDRKTAQAALREAEMLRRLTIVVRDAYDAITVRNLAGGILAWNPAAQRIYGWTETEALALDLRDLIPEAQREADLAVVQKLSQSLEVEPYRTQRVAKDGRIVEIWLTATALVNEAGTVYALATTEREIGKTEGLRGA